MNHDLLVEAILEALLDEAKKKKKKRKTKYPKQYKAKGKRKKTLDRATKLAKSKDPADRARAYKMRDNQERYNKLLKSYKSIASMNLFRFSIFTRKVGNYK